MTSSLRNSLHRRNHKERSQLAHRARYGILEKHKDYVLRARDYHSKQDRLTRLRQKAADRNKDEFYFGMNNERTVGGVHVKDRGNQAMPVDIVKLLKTQDEGYVRTVKNIGLKKIERIKQQLTALANLVSSPHEGLRDGEHALDDAEMEILQESSIIPRTARRKKSATKHIVFAEDEEQARQYVEKYKSRQVDAEPGIPNAESEELDLGWKSSESETLTKRRKGKLPAQPGSMKEAADESQKLAITNRQKLLKELSARLKRDTQLRYAQRELEMQRLLIGKGGRRKLSGVELVGSDKEDEDEDDEDDPRVNKRIIRKAADEKIYKPRVYKWRLERKR